MERASKTLSIHFVYRGEGGYEGNDARRRKIGWGTIRVSGKGRKKKKGGKQFPDGSWDAVFACTSKPIG